MPLHHNAVSVSSSPAEKSKSARDRGRQHSPEAQLQLALFDALVHYDDRIATRKALIRAQIAELEADIALRERIRAINATVAA